MFGEALWPRFSVNIKYCEYIIIVNVKIIIHVIDDN